MNLLSKSANYEVYIIANQAKINHRLKGIISLKGSFEKLMLITRNGPRIYNKHLVIRPYYNPLGIFRLIGFNQIKKSLERHLFFPSAQILYVRPVIRRLKKLIAYDLQKTKKVCIITILPPHDLSIIGLSLKKEFPQIQWIVDWQDLWSWDEYYSKRVSKLYKNKLLNLEISVLTKCDVNVTTNIKAKEILEEHYRIDPERIVAINHHFYRPDFKNDLKDSGNQYSFKIDNKIKIGFLGALFKPPKVPGSKVVKAIENIRKLDLNVELHIFGDKSKLAEKAAYNSKGNAVVIHPTTNHKQSLLNISQCHFLLLALSNSPNAHVVMHSKLPHYLLLKRPILAIVPKNSFVAQLINKTRSGYIISTDSNWETRLENIIRNYSEAEYNSQRNEKEIEKYSWDNISKYWLQVIKGITIIDSG